MANQLYAHGRRRFLEGAINWLTDDIKVVLVDLADYTPDLAADEFLAAIPAGARVATSGSLTGKTSTAGTADADNIAFSAVTGDLSEALVIYKDTGSAATSPLIFYVDTAGGLPVQPNGGDVLVSWDDATDRIFTL